MRLSKEFRTLYSQHELRTYGRKNGFVTAGQEARLLKWLPKIGLPKDKTLNDAGLPEGAPVVLEIGFGNGDFLVHLAQTHPDWCLLGVEIYLPGVAKAVGRKMAQASDVMLAGLAARGLALAGEKVRKAPAQ